MIELRFPPVTGVHVAVQDEGEMDVAVVVVALACALIRMCGVLGIDPVRALQITLKEVRVGKLALH